jgi:hypothetical protein
MAIVAGVRIVLECDPNRLGAGSNPWTASIDFGHKLQFDGGAGNPHMKNNLAAASHSALNTAVASACSTVGIT